MGSLATPSTVSLLTPYGVTGDTPVPFSVSYCSRSLVSLYLLSLKVRAPFEAIVARRHARSRQAHPPVQGGWADRPFGQLETAKARCRSPSPPSCWTGNRVLVIGAWLGLRRCRERPFR
jgi:hypothetical protein